ncbi:MAG: hypothetical protein HN904_04215, partial [Victivallales bacterium]|nr:hypothetical protein [Victivallales bacterium]
YDYSISLPGLFPVNAPPTPPTTLSAAHDGHGVLTFTWGDGADDTTPVAGLSYELRCGTTAGAGGTIHGEMGQSGLQLREPPTGTLHWQVRTIDAAGVPSPWSTAQETVVPAYSAQYRLELAASPAGSGTLAATPPGPLFTAGTSVTLTATPAPGFQFSGWAGDTAGLTRSTGAILTIGEHRWIQAQFAPIPNPVHPTWSLVADPLLSPAGYWSTTGHTLESFAGQLVRLAGEGGWAPRTPQDWVMASSDDGNTWRSVFLDGSTPVARYNHSSAVFDGKLWLVGGIGSGGTWLTDVWHTTDLVHWTQTPASAPWTGRDGGSLVVAGGKLWFLGGGRWGQRDADVWHSPDGVTWTAVPTPAPWSQSHIPGDTTSPWAVAGVSVRATVLDDVLYATDGASVWRSPDGVNWTLKAMEPDPIIPLPEGVTASPFAPLQKFGFAVFDGQLVILGGENWRLGETKNDVWSSSNGSDWSRTAPVTRAHWDPQETPAACLHNGKLFLVSGESAAGAAIGDVWSCSPGVMPGGMGALELEATPLSPWVGGTTEPPPGSYVGNLGSILELRAVPSYGYALDHWEGPVSDDGDGDPTTMNVALSATETRVKAVFTFATTRLTVRTEPYRAGHTTPEEQTAYTYPPDQYVDLSAVAKQGYTFSHWTGPVEDANSDRTRVFMDTAHEVVAVFLAMPVRARMSCATDWAAVVRPDGTVWGVGNNANSQMGHALSIDEPAEFWPVALTTGVSQVYVEDDGAKAVLVDGTIQAWGTRFHHYEIGVKPHASTNLTNVAQCTGDTNLSAAYRKSDGTLCNYLGELFGKTFWDGELDDVIDISGRGDSHFAVQAGGKLFAWGSNLAGQLGIANIQSAGSPREVPGIDRVYCTVSGFDALHPFVLALRDDGTVWSWGDPRGGQLGRTITRAVPADPPAAIPGLANVMKVAAGATHALALTHTGELYAWGGNHFGQLGTGTFDNAATPILIPTPAAVTDVAAGPFYTLLHLADDTYYWMGATPGDASAPLTVPTAIVGLGAGTTRGQLTTVEDPTETDGEIYPPEGVHPVILNRPVRFQATDGARYVFAHWSTLDTDPAMQLTLTGDTTVTARFRFAYDAMARLTIDVAGNGSVNPAPGEHEYAPGTVLTVTALPAAGHAFSHWEGAVAEVDASRTTVLMDRDQTVRACFEPIPQDVPPCVVTGLTSYYDGMFL